jgi:hypothetical protein
MLSDNEVSCLDDASKAVASLKQRILFGTDPDLGLGLPPMAEMHFLQAVAHLDLAMSALKLADYCRMQNR